MTTETFPIDLGKLLPLKLDPAVASLTDDQRAALRHNIQLARDTIVFFTALAGAKGLSGHTGGAYDTVPEVMIIRAFIAQGAPIVPVFYDEAGHRVATQYLLSVLNGAMPPERLLHRLFHSAGVTTDRARALSYGCRCSRARLAGILEGFSPDDLDHMAVDGDIVMTCEFCNYDFRFPRQDVHGRSAAS